MENSKSLTFLDFMGRITNPRKPYNQLHSFLNIVVIAVLTTLCGADTWNEIENWGNACKDWRSAFLAEVITMKNSWRAGIPESGKTEFVSRGIYKYSRNPAFLGFDLMYAGILFMYFNWLSLFFSLWAAVMLHLQILQEEKYLLAVFGGEYSAYTEHTCRYLGRKSKEL